MRFPPYKLFAIAIWCLFAGLVVARADTAAVETTKNLPDQVGGFRGVGSINVPAEGPHDEERRSYAVRNYKARSGKTYLVELSDTFSESAAYALLTSASGFNGEIKLGVIGTASIIAPRRVLFCKGAHFASVAAEDKTEPSESEMLELARSIADQLDGIPEIPVLIKHLPESDKIGRQAFYAVTLNRLKSFVPNQPIFDALTFEGGAEAVVAQYDAGTLVIVEFNTPQIATTNDHNVASKLNELKATVPEAGTPAPAIYRRVGNYGVFVFDAPSQEAANRLIDQVKYQQVVTWLGENPFSYEKATREFTETTLGVLVSVVKASGIALVSCLAIGGFAGALLFNLRRSQQRAREAYADSDAMLRLNIDELTPEKDSTQLLGSGRSS